MTELTRTPARLPHSRLAFTMTVVLAVLAVTPTSEAGQAPRYEELPVGVVTSPPTGTKPSSIPGSESVPGIRVTPGTSPYQALLTFDDGKPGRAAGSTQVPPSTLEGVKGCFSQLASPNAPASLSSFAVLADAPQRPVEWEGSGSWQGMLWGPPHATGVSAMHAERLVERDGAMSLESTDLWIDHTTRGVRLVAKANLPLRQIGSAPGGVKVFAGRDERPDGKRYVQFVITRSKDTPLSQIGVTATRSDGSIVAPGACSHNRVALAATRSGETANIQLSTILPDLPPGELSTAVPLPPLPPGSRDARDVRSRAVRVHVSVSRTSRDKDPIIAVSTAWGGPEVQSRVFTSFAMPPTPPPRAVMGKPMASSIDPGF